jgi:hypothetical protein
LVLPFYIMDEYNDGIKLIDAKNRVVVIELWK